MKCLLLIMFFTVVSAQALDLSPLFSDHMVLQQQTAVPVWGTAEPGTAVVVKSEWGETAETRADQDGHWFVELETVQADGPFTLTISAFNDTIRIQDVMLGEVWLCSGQSNMEMPLAGWPPADTVRHSAREIRSADYPRIRMFMAARSVAMQPKNEISGSWKPCTPETAFAFSATAYFFALNLYQQLDVPIGLLHSSWGGTPVQAWMDAEALRETGEFLKVLDALQEGDEKIKAYNRWLEEKETIKVPNRDLDKFWAQLDFGQTVVADPEFDDSQCNTMELPQTWEDTEIGAFDGVVWFRRSIDIPKAWKDRELTLQLGPVDDMDATFFNGTEIGRLQQNGAWQVNRTYHVSAEQVKTGSNVIAVRVIDTGGGGGIYGEPKQMKLFPKDQPEIALPLSGDWAFLPTAEFRGNTFYLFDVNPPDFYSKPDLPFVVGPHTPSMLYNGMIAPLTPYRIKGAIWYQGESNTGNPDQYAQLFPQMIRHWRQNWGIGDFPFYFVQIAPYDYGAQTESQRLREAQMQALKLPHTGMAVTLDIGNPQNIHPANKQDVGARLARWALNRDYNRDVYVSGPLYQNMTLRDDKIVCSFDYVDGGLKLTADPQTHFEIAGADSVFRPAEVEINGNFLVVSHPDIDTPLAARYAWDNTSDAILFNEKGLPASSFRTDDWPR